MELVPIAQLSQQVHRSLLVAPLKVALGHLVHPGRPGLGFGGILEAKTTAASAPHSHIVHDHWPLRDDKAKLPHVPLHEGCPEVPRTGRAGCGWVLVGRHHQGTVSAPVAQVQEALSADLGPGEALGLQGVHTLLLQAAQPLVQLHEGLRRVEQGAGLLCLVHHVSQGQPQGRQQPAVPVDVHGVHAQGPGNGTCMLPTSSPKAGQHMG